MKSRYELERYKGMRSRYECPVCHHKGVFVRYIDTETGLYLSPEVGRCNREDKCGYHYTPKQYFDSHPTERPEANIIRHPKQITAPKSIDTIPKQYIIVILEYFYNLLRHRRFGRKSKNEVMIWQPFLFLRFAVSCFHCHSS